MLKDPRRVSRGCEWPACRDGWLCGELVAGVDAQGRLACQQHLEDAAWVARAQAAEMEGRFLGPKESMQVLRKMARDASRHNPEASTLLSKGDT